MDATGTDLQPGSALTATEPPASTAPPPMAQAPTVQPPITPAQTTHTTGSDTSIPQCPNCGAPVPRRYCGECGQRLEHALHTVGHFLREATEDLTHADSRIWRTLLALLFKPGYLTREFLDGRRARYLPPLRLYLVVSLVFFVLAGATRSEPTLIVETSDGPGHARTFTLRSLSGAVTSEVARSGSAASESARSASMISKSGGVAGKAINTQDAPKVDPWAPRPGETPAQRADRLCGQSAVRTLFDRWIQPQSLCRKMLQSGGNGLEEKMLHNVARAMFVFLPVFAMIMTLMYWRPRRYYVEHLLYLVHLHAFAFLVFGLAVLVALLPWQPLSIVFQPIASLYFLYYVFRSMRSVYGQGRLLTAAKLAVLAIAYLVFGAVMVAAASVYSVMTLA